MVMGLASTAHVRKLLTEPLFANATMDGMVQSAMCQVGALGLVFLYHAESHGHKGFDIAQASMRLKGLDRRPTVYQSFLLCS